MGRACPSRPGGFGRTINVQRYLVNAHVADGRVDRRWRRVIVNRPCGRIRWVGRIGIGFHTIAGMAVLTDGEVSIFSPPEM